MAEITSGQQTPADYDVGTAASRTIWYALPVAETLTALQTRSEGLTTEEATVRKARFGPNRLPSAPRPSLIARFLLQFHNLLIYVLLGAAVLAAAIGHTADAGVVLAVVLINAVIGFVQEGRAERALDAIRSMIDPHASVLRDGRRSVIGAEDIVPGDLVLLEPGDRVAADLRLVRLRSLRIDEAALTGESVPVDKALDEVDADAPLGDRTSMAFSGTFVASGTGMGAAVATGSKSELGHISTLVGTVETLTTPLLQRMSELSRKLTVLILVASAVVFAFAIYVRGYQWPEAFMVMIGLAVAAIPEGLPAVMTITLAIGVRRMARRNAIIRRLPAVETLGSVSVICSDKTGTLTRNEMTVRTLLTTEGRFDVSGVGYRPEGEFELGGGWIEATAHPTLQVLWINMVTTVALGLTLAFEPTEPGAMQRPPRSPNEPLLSRRLLWRVGLVSLLFVTGAFGIFFYAVERGLSVELARTMVVNMIVVMEILYLFSVRYVHGPSLTWQGIFGTPAVLGGVALVTAAQLAFTYLPVMQRVFHTVPVAPFDGLLIVGVGVVLLLIVELEKRIFAALVQ